MVWEDVQKIENPNGTSDDDFGESVSVSENYAIVGSLLEGAGGTDAGAAYFYQLDSDGVWNLAVKKIGGAGDEFGVPSSVSDNYAIVAAVGDGGSYKGAVYFYERDSNGDWNQVKKVQGEANDDFFGISVSISGNDAVVGAYNNNDGGTNAGAAYFYQRDGSGNWSQVKKFIGEAAGDQFGQSVSISGDHAVVGANLNDDGALNAGATYFYQRDGSGDWNQVKKFLGEAIGDLFGYSVSISGNNAIVGAMFHDDAGNNAGAVYFYQLDGVWNLVQTKILGEAADDRFGISVSIFGNNAVVGANLNDDGGSNSGAAYFYQLDSDGVWNQVKKHSGVGGGDKFGVSVSISKNYSFCGANQTTPEYVKIFFSPSPPSPDNNDVTSSDDKDTTYLSIFIAFMIFFCGFMLYILMKFMGYSI